MATKGLKGPIIKIDNMYKLSTSEFAIKDDKHDLLLHLSVRPCGAETATTPGNKDALIRSKKDISELMTTKIVVPRAAIPMEARCVHLSFNGGVCDHGCYLLEHSRISNPPDNKYPRAWMGSFDAKVRWELDHDSVWLVNVGNRDNSDGRLIVLLSEKWDKAIHPRDV